MVAATLAVIALIIFSENLLGDDDGGNASVCPEELPIDGPAREAVLGDPNAPLTIVEYSDFQCGFCARAALEIVPRIEDEFLTDGRAKLVFKHYAFEGQESILAAEAAECAGDQGEFWGYHDTLFANQADVFNKPTLERFAEELGLDTTVFNECLESRKHQAKVNNDRAFGCREDDINSTPTFLVGDTKIVGAKGWDVFEAAIQQELAKLGETTPTPSPESDETG
jgi:protein-disulfide isomerase